MEGIHWIVRTEEQRQNFLHVAKASPLPFSAKIGKPQHPKTLKQIRYAHSMIEALAIDRHMGVEVAKRDCKVAFGVTVVHHSLVTGEKTARLVSFADYTREQMEAFLTAMEVFLSEQGIPFTPSE